ncbi:MarR family transcriptional regulator [Kibdelosporangium aridum]|uniref:MarR family transcriptional regulator n=1 Tax=Kibdelosporangium aridum TaxID=2030 RepID=A0A428ZNS2_KIBAR|nr:MarR family transcriptional regulator [Kibdelosporangium aridum]RSM89704.1 MarR family transcriptional regulator [Kibdelosporangium aridum]
MPGTPEPRWLTAEELAAWRSFSLMTSMLTTALDSQLQRDSQLSYVEYYTLAGLSESPEWTMRISELAVFVNAELSRMSHLIKRLEGRGFVRREADPTDGRYTNAILTKEGHEHLVRAAPGHVTAVRRLVIDALDPAALRALRSTSDTIIGRMMNDQ